jgi:hypothetical protein
MNYNYTDEILNKYKPTTKDWLLFIGAIICLIVGAKYNVIL